MVTKVNNIVRSKISDIIKIKICQNERSNVLKKQAMIEIRGGGGHPETNLPKRFKPLFKSIERAKFYFIVSIGNKIIHNG